MRTALATFCKELLLLGRDRSGLLLLFAMPAVLVLVVTLVQDNVMQDMGRADVKALFLDLDQQGLGDAFADQLAAAGFDLVREVDGRAPSLETLKELVGQGRFRCGIVLPEGTTDAFHRHAADSMRRVVRKDAGLETKIQPLPVHVFFDPLAQGAFRFAVLAGVQGIVQGLEFEYKSRGLGELLPAALARNLQAHVGPDMTDILREAMPLLPEDWATPRLFTVREQSPLDQPGAALPNAVQQNVPAWALFGMFFIVLPMAGAMLKERQDGVLGRLLVMPVSIRAVMAGKVAAYVLVCLVQFSFVVLMGVCLLPVLGLPELNAGSSPTGLVLMALCAALAATGYGMLLGVLVRTYEQASVIGPVSVVAASALGGVMVPVHVMPQAMQTISSLSPLAWGLNGFLDIFVRQGDVGTVLPQALLLLGFSATCIAVAWLFLKLPGRGGM